MYLVLAVLLLCSSAIGVSATWAEESDSYVDFSAGISNQEALMVVYDDAAVENRLEISSDNTHFGNGVSIVLDGAQVCSGFAECRYDFTSTQGSSHTVLFREGGDRLPFSYNYRVAGRAVPCANCSPYVDGVIHWSAVPKMMPFGSGDLLHWFNQLMSGLFNEYLATAVGIVIFGWLLRGIVLALANASARNGGGPNSHRSSNERDSDEPEERYGGGGAD